jgi:hypothetical protein
LRRPEAAGGTPMLSGRIVAQAPLRRSVAEDIGTATSPPANCTPKAPATPPDHPGLPPVAPRVTPQNYPQVAKLIPVPVPAGVR